MKSAGQVEAAVREVYTHCPPTLTSYAADGRAAYERFWKRFMADLGAGPEAFAGRTVLDVGCGSCEKTVFYHDWGARVTGIEMTPSIVAIGRGVIGSRSIRLIETSLVDYSPSERFDLVIADGVLHHTADTFAALRRCAAFVVDGGLLVVGLVNVWGRFWWFKPARAITRLLGRGDFHRQARWGQRLFGWTRASQENASEGVGFFRGADSWAYDWFGNPRWNLHSPVEVRRWFDELGLVHVGSIPSIVRKPGGRASALLASLVGPDARLLPLAWLFSQQPNMFYVCGRKAAGPT